MPLICSRSSPICLIRSGGICPLFIISATCCIIPCICCIMPIICIMGPLPGSLN